MSTIHNQSQISSELVKAKLTIKQFGKTQRDDEAKNRTAAHHNAEAAMFTAGRKLLDPADLKAIEKSIGVLRNTFRARTRAWGDDKWRVYAAKDWADFNREMNKLVRNTNQHVAELVKRWDEVVANAKSKLNTAANDIHYPAADEIGSYYVISIETANVEDPNDLRINISDREKAKLKKEMERNQRSKLAGIAAESLKLLYEQVKTVHDNLTPSNGGSTKEEKDRAKKDQKRGHKTFRDSLISNVRQQVKLAQTMNLDNDPRVQEIVDDIDNSLTKHEPQELRDDAKVRKDARKAAADILQKMEGYN